MEQGPDRGLLIASVGGALLSGGVAALVGLLGDLSPIWSGFGGALGGALASLFLHRRHTTKLKGVVEQLDAGLQTQSITTVSGPDGELGGLAQGIDHLLGRMTELSAQNVDQDRELRWAQEKLSLQEDLDRTNQNLSRRLRERELLTELTHTFTSSLDIDEVLGTVCHRVAQRLEIDEVAIVLYDSDSNELVLTAAQGIPDFDRLGGLRFTIGEGVTGSVWYDEPLVYVADLSSDERYLGWKGHHAHASGAMVVLRMAFQDDKIGILDCVRVGSGGFSAEEIKMLRIVADQAAIAVRNARLYRQTLDMATHDELTGLWNRRWLMEQFEAAWARGRRFGDSISALVIDIDRFKAYNDTHGHLVGDRVLRQVAQALGGAVRRVDIVGRYGGEEFVVVLPRCASTQALCVAEKLRATVEDLELQGVGVGVSAPTISIGVSALKPAEVPMEYDPIELLRSADQALLKAKEAGRNRVILAS